MLTDRVDQELLDAAPRCWRSQITRLATTPSTSRQPPHAESPWA
jgi:hypothetical protein